MKKLLLFLLLSASPAFATTFYVAKSGDGGSDSNNCTQAQTIGTAKLTIAAGISCMSAGDTLEIRRGTYAESVYLTLPSGISNGSRTIIKNHSGDTKPTLNGNLTLALEDNITWDGVNIDDSGDSNDIDDCVLINSGSNITITNADIKNCQRHGFDLNDGNGANLSNITLSYLTVHNTGQGYLTSADPRHHNFYISAHNFTTGPIVIDHCESYNTNNPANAGTGGPSGSAGNSWGIQVYSTSTGFLDGVVLSNNYVHDNNQGIVVGSGTNHKIFNNIVYNNDNAYSYGEAAITIGYGSPNTGIEVYNNTIVQNTFAGAYCMSLASFGVVSGAIIKNNICWANGSDTIHEYAGASGNTITKNLLATNPVFGNNFALQSTSPALVTNGFAGANESALFTTDIDGTLRQTGSNAWDAGARTVSSGGGGGGGTPPPPTPPAAPANLRIVP